MTRAQGIYCNAKYTHFHIHACLNSTTLEFKLMVLSAQPQNSLLLLSENSMAICFVYNVCAVQGGVFVGECCLAKLICQSDSEGSYRSVDPPVTDYLYW